MSIKIHHPHDSFAKRMLSDIEVAKPIIKSQIPPEIARRIDWESLQLTNKSFVNEKLEQFHSDVVHRCTIDNKQAYIYSLIEHVRHEVARNKSAAKAARLHSNLSYHYFGAKLATV